MNTTGPVRARPTNEVVMIILSLTVGLILLITIVMIGVIEIVHPELNTDEAIGAVSGTISVLVGAIVGYLAGKRVDGTGITSTTTPPPPAGTTTREGDL